MTDLIFIAATLGAGAIGFMLANSYWLWRTKKLRKTIDEEIAKWKEDSLAKLEDIVAGDVPFSVKSDWPPRNQQEEGKQ